MRVKILKFVSFIGTGALTYLTFSVLASLLTQLAIHYAFAIILAYIPSATFHFLANRSFLASSKTSRVAISQITRYLTFSIFAGLFHVVVSFYVVGVLELDTLISTAVSTVIWLPIGFFLMKNWVFSRKQGAPVDSN